MTESMLFWHRVMVQGKRSLGNCLMIACLATCSLYGCKSPYEDSGTDAPARPAVSATIDAQVRTSTEGFTKQVQAGDFTKAVSFFSADMQKRMSVVQLAQTTKSGSLSPLVSATPLRYEPVQMNAKGNRATVRLAFDTSQQKNYRMNFVVAKVGSDWKIDAIVPPTKHREPVVSRGATSTSKQ